jgi:hypothetical protein
MLSSRWRGGRLLVTPTPPAMKWKTSRVCLPFGVITTYTADVVRLGRRRETESSARRAWARVWRVSHWKSRQIKKEGVLLGC